MTTIGFSRAYFLLIQRIFVYKAFIDAPFFYSMGSETYRTNLVNLIYAENTDIVITTINTIGSTPVVLNTVIKSLFDFLNGIPNVYPILVRVFCIEVPVVQSMKFS